MTTKVIVEPVASPTGAPEVAPAAAKRAVHVKPIPTIPDNCHTTVPRRILRKCGRAAYAVAEAIDAFAFRLCFDPPMWAIAKQARVSLSTVQRAVIALKAGGELEVSRPAEHPHQRRGRKDLRRHAYRLTRTPRSAKIPRPSGHHDHVLPPKPGQTQVTMTTFSRATADGTARKQPSNTGGGNTGRNRTGRDPGATTVGMAAPSAPRRSLRERHVSSENPEVLDRQAGGGYDAAWLVDTICQNLMHRGPVPLRLDFNEQLAALLRRTDFDGVEPNRAKASRERGLVTGIAENCESRPPTDKEREKIGELYRKYVEPSGSGG